MLPEIFNRYKITECDDSLCQSPIEGWMKEGNKELMLPHIKDAKIILELGSWYGKSANWFLTNSNADVICVDTWCGSVNHHYIESNAEWFPKLSNLFETFKSNLISYKDRLYPIRATSIDGIRIISRFNVCPDICYIDAGHEYNDVISDIANILYHFPGCLNIFGDDLDWPGVKSAVKDVLEELKKGDSLESYTENGICYHIKLKPSNDVNVIPYNGYTG